MHGNTLVGSQTQIKRAFIQDRFDVAAHCCVLPLLRTDRRNPTCASVVLLRTTRVRCPATATAALLLPVLLPAVRLMTALYSSSSCAAEALLCSVARTHV
jgi:hypothetical protein